MPTSSENALHEMPENLLEQAAVLRWLADTEPNSPLTSERIARSRLENQLWCATKAQVVRKEHRIVWAETVGCLLMGYPIGLFVSGWFDQMLVAAALLLLAIFLRARIALAFGAACDVLTDAKLQRLGCLRVACLSAADRIKAVRVMLDASCTPEVEKRARAAGWRKALMLWDWAHSLRRRDSHRGWIHHAAAAPRTKPVPLPAARHARIHRFLPKRATSST